MTDLKTIARTALKSFADWLASLDGGVDETKVQTETASGYDCEAEAQIVCEAIGSGNGLMTVTCALHEAYDSGKFDGLKQAASSPPPLESRQPHCYAHASGMCAALEANETLQRTVNDQARRLVTAAETLLQIRLELGGGRTRRTIWWCFVRKSTPDWQ